MVLRRNRVGESDLLVTVLSASRGKFLCRVNGVRKLHSKKRGMLEPGAIIEAFFVVTKGLPLLTQSTALSHYATPDLCLAQHRQFSLFLELCDKLFVESALDDEMYAQIVQMRQAIVENTATNRQLQSDFGGLIAQLGYQHPADSKYTTISDYISALSDKPVRSYDYLSVLK